MSPGEARSKSPDSYNSSSAFCSSGSRPTISADNATSYKHPLFHSHNYLQPQDTSYCSAYSRDMAARNSERALNLSPRNQSIQAAVTAGYLSREEAQFLMMQDAGNYGAHSMQLAQGLSMNNMQAQLYNEQILRSMSGSHFTGIEPTENYEELLMNSMQAQQQISGISTSHGAVLQNLGRSVTSAHDPVRYEETCTPRPRWSPTPEQIEILEALFNSGTRTPSRDMIADIAVQLRKYGTIAEANVFYWFQNRKARAKRKQLQPASAAAAH